MASCSKILLNHNLKRYFCKTTSFAKYAGREARFFKKMLGGDNGKRKWHVNKERSSNPLTPEKVTSNHVNRRVTVLNKLFMQHITDLMAMGEASSELLGRSIEISHVRVTPDFQLVLVYWYSKRGENFSETEKILEDCAFSLRHELTQLRVIGRVPLIKFVQNKQLAALDELEKRFRSADYGDDYEPIVTPIAPKTELTLTTKLPPEVRKQIAELEETMQIEDEGDETLFDVDLPPMRQDVLGLNHHTIMSKVKHSLKIYHESAKDHLSNVVTFTPTGNNSTFDPSTFQTTKDNSTAFTEFLAKRQLEDKRKMRRERRDAVSSCSTESEINSNDYYLDEFTNDEEDVDGFEDISLEDIK